MEWHSNFPPRANPSFNKQGGCFCSIPLLEISAVSPDAFWGIWYTFAKPLPLGLAELRRTLRVSNMSWVSNGEGEDQAVLLILSVDFCLEAFGNSFHQYFSHNFKKLLYSLLLPLSSSLKLSTKERSKTPLVR